MFKLCPFCGHSLDKELYEGITTCGNCQRVFDSCKYNRILSAAWVARKWHCEIDQLYRLGFKDDEVEIVSKYVIEDKYSHDEFLKVPELAEFK